MNTLLREHDLVRTMLAVVILLVLLGTAFWILRPLLPAILWSSAIVISTWPLLVGLEQRLGGRRGLAAGILTTVLTLLLLLPFFLGVVGIVNNTERIAEAARSLSTTSLPQPPGWLERLPLAGERIAAAWRQIAEAGSESLLARLAPYADRVVHWLLGQLGGVGRIVFHFVLTLIGVAFLYLHGDTVGARVCRFSVRLAGSHGDDAVRLAAQATRSVALGVLLTSVIQALLAAAGLWVAGVPSVAVLTVVMIVTGLAQLGPMPVLVPAVVWLFWQGDIGWGIVLGVWAAFVGVIDNVLRPILIRRGADLPMMLVFVGVVGGLLAFGVVGLFIGPVVLAVVYRLQEAWVALGQPPVSSVGVTATPPAGDPRSAR